MVNWMMPSKHTVMNAITEDETHSQQLLHVSRVYRPMQTSRHCHAQRARTSLRKVYCTGVHHLISSSYQKGAGSTNHWQCVSRRAWMSHCHRSWCTNSHTHRAMCCLVSRLLAQQHEASSMHDGARHAHAAHATRNVVLAGRCCLCR